MTDETANPPTTSASTTANDLPSLVDVITNLQSRLIALENKPALNVTPEQIAAAVSEHPDIVAFRAFADKWRNHA